MGLLFRWFGCDGLHWSVRFGHHITDFSGLNLIPCDSAGFAGVGLDESASASLELASAPGGDENVAIFAIEFFLGFHSDVPQRLGLDGAILKDSKTGRTFSWLFVNKHRSAMRASSRSSGVSGSPDRRARSER